MAQQAGKLTAAMGTLASELVSHAARLAGVPRVYADANVPAGVVAFMRAHLGWDVLFVIEHDDLRRASDLEHFRRAHDLGRTLITQDRDYLDDARFDARAGSGVIVLSAPNERALIRLLHQAARGLFVAGVMLPLAGRRIHMCPDWSER